MIGASSPLNGPPRVGAPAGPPPIGAPRPLGGSPMGPPPIVGNNAPPPLSSPLSPPGVNAPPPLAPLGGIGASPLGMPPLSGSPLSPPLSPPMGGIGAPPILRPPGGLGPAPAAMPPAIAPPSLSANTGPLAPSAPVPPASSGASAPIFGPMPPLPNAAPPPVAPMPPVAPPPPQMPPLNPYGPAPVAGVAPVAEPPPNNPAPLLGVMPPLPAVSPAASPIAGGGDPFANVSMHGDPFAGVAAASSDPFASAPGADPYAAPYPPPAKSGGDPFAGAGVQNPFQRSGPAARLPTAMGPMDAGMPSGVRVRGATALGGAWANPLAPAVEQPTETRSRIASRARLLVTQLDGTEQGEVALGDGENLVGREVGGLFAEDNLLSSRHATIIVQGGAAWVRDEGSRNGVYVRIPRQVPVELRDGDQFCFGRIILRFEQRPPASAVVSGDYAGMLTLVVGRDVDRGMFPYPVTAQGLTIGRTRADLRFPSDGWVSGAHCAISVAGPQVLLTDVGSSNGTFVRIRGTRPLQHGDALLMGQRIFHVQLQ